MRLQETDIDPNFISGCKYSSEVLFVFKLKLNF